MMKAKDVYPSILFVCTANRARSVLAEAILKSALCQMGSAWENWRVESAGTWAAPNLPPLAATIQVARKMGFEVAPHRSRRIDEIKLDEFDLILVMEPNHKEALRAEFPFLSSRIFMLSEMIGKDLTIFDPAGQDETDFLQSAQEISDYIHDGLRNIIALATRPL